MQILLKSSQEEKMSKHAPKQSEFVHVPVLLHEVLDYLQVQSGKKYIDGTAGGGGHAEEIVKRGGSVLCIDQDQEAIEHLQNKFKDETRVRIVKGNFSDIAKIARLQAIGGQAHLQDFQNCSGILFDLGMSSFQIDASSRGFSFLKDQPLDMRMNTDTALTAHEIVNKWQMEDLEEIFLKYGEEENARQIAEAIVLQRKEKKFETTKELVDLLIKIGRGNTKIHPATRVFQALRIAVNMELDVLKIGITDAIGLLEPKGRLVILSFHSLEDRIVKNMFRNMEQEGQGVVLNKKPITAGLQETETNRRSRSAKMRVFEKK